MNKIQRVIKMRETVIKMAERGWCCRIHVADRRRRRRRWLPAHQYVRDSGPLHGPVAAESEAGLAVDVLRVPHVGAVVALVDGHVYPRSFGVRL